MTGEPSESSGISERPPDGVATGTQGRTGKIGADIPLGAETSEAVPDGESWPLRKALRYWLAVCVMTRLGRPGSWVACRLLYRYHADGTRTAR
jgi:hypothetical protein